MNKIYRIKTLEFQIREVINDTNVKDYFEVLFDSEKSADALASFIGNNRDNPFINLIHREERVEQWIKYINHESSKDSSIWNKRQLKTLPEKIDKWINCLKDDSENCNDLAISKIEKRLLKQGISLEKKERARIGIRVFREMLWRLRGGIEE